MPAVDLMGAEQLRDRQVAYYTGLEQTMRRLSAMAKAELAAKPFSRADPLWLKKTVDQRGGGSGRPRRPIGDRLTDPQWQAKIQADKLPERPDWTRSFLSATPLQRTTKR